MYSYQHQEQMFFEQEQQEKKNNERQSENSLMTPFLKFTSVPHAMLHNNTIRTVEVEDEQTRKLQVNNQTQPFKRVNALLTKTQLENKKVTSTERNEEGKVSTINNTSETAHLPVPVLTGSKTDALIALHQLFGTDKMSKSKHDLSLRSQRQHVSTILSSRDDVIALHAALEERLQQRRALHSGICPIRREIYNDIFHELIRQVTLEEPVRGVLLRRVKDYYDHALLVHSDLHQRGCHFASHVQSNSLNGMSELNQQVKKLEKDKELLLRKLHEVEEREKNLQKAITDARVRRSKEQQDELAYLRKSNQQLSLRLKAETERTSLTTNNNSSNAAAAAAAAAVVSSVNV